jgi:hypothetical protein
LACRKAKERSFIKNSCRFLKNNITLVVRLAALPAQHSNRVLVYAATVIGDALLRPTMVIFNPEIKEYTNEN